MKLIWHGDLREHDWIRDIFAGHIDSEIIDNELNHFVDGDALHVVTTHSKRLRQYENYFRRCRERCQYMALFQCSDEFFSGDYYVYRYFDAVFRNYYTYLTTSDAVFTVPLGYPDNTHHPTITPVQDRRYAWSFVGEMKTSRITMASTLDEIKPSLVVGNKVDGQRVDKREYDAILNDSIFSPCPMGNNLLETWRLYEGLEAGCIPLVEARRGLTYFQNLLGPNPIPMFQSWTDARGFITTALDDKKSLTYLQSHISDWWTEYKTNLRKQIGVFISTSHQPTILRFSALPHNRWRILYDPLRFTEILRHQNTDSLRWRLKRPSGPLRRVMNDMGWSRETK